VVLKNQANHLTPASAASAATALQESVAAIDSQSVTLAPTVSMKSALDDPGRPPQVAVADKKQGWEICDIAKCRWSIALLGTMECRVGAQI
jgi:hypothetical protein